MRISLNWLSDYLLKFDSAKAKDLPDRLTMAGLEVEAVTDIGENLKGVVIGEVTKKEKHPNADRLSLCEVNIGKERLKIVCGAANVRAGLKVPVAVVGTLLPNGMTIKKTKIRDELSEGMICSTPELGLAETSEGIMELPDDLKIGTPFSTAMNMEDRLLDISLTPNRGDCLSYLGVAREIATLYRKKGVKLSPPKIKLLEINEKTSKFVTVTIAASEACPRYSARIIRNLKVRPSPIWLRRRLEENGIRSINNIVDITNYVMLERGQPFHAFDYDKINGRKINVRLAKKGEKFIPLDGKERVLQPGDILICDAAEPIALGGVMGGTNSEVTPKTTTVLLESAYFDPTAIRITSRRLCLISESSLRFERGVDPDGVISGLDRAAALMAELGGGEILKDPLDIYPKPTKRIKIDFRPSKAEKILGTKIDPKNTKEILSSLGFKVAVSGKDKFRVEVPGWRRPDVARESDLIEEIARINGYENIAATLPGGRLVENSTLPDDLLLRFRKNISEHLAGLGWLEVINFSFLSPSLLAKADISEKGIRLINPVGEEFSMLRPSLLPSLLSTIKFNLNMQNRNLRLFETRTVFLNPKSGARPEEKFRLTGVMTGLTGAQHWSEETKTATIYDAKGTVETIFDKLNLQVSINPDPNGKKFLHPHHQLSILLDKDDVGWVGEIHPDILDRFDIDQPVTAFEIDLDRLLKSRHSSFKYKPVSKYPTIKRDLSLLIPRDELVEKLLSLIRKMAPSSLQACDLFDVYKGERIEKDKRSIAISLTFGSDDKTLTDDEVDQTLSKLTAGLASTGNYKLRE